MSAIKTMWIRLLQRLGWNNASENHLSPDHGWLLPKPSFLRDARDRNDAAPPAPLPKP